MPKGESRSTPEIRVDRLDKENIECTCLLEGSPSLGLQGAEQEAGRWG